MRPARYLALVLAASPAAPWTAAGQADTLRACPPARAPRELPALDSVLDSTLAVRVFTLPDSFPPTELVLTLQFDRDGAVRRIAALERTRGADTADAAVRAVSQIVRSQRAADPWAVRLRVRLPGPPHLAIERSAYCPPELIPSRSSLPSLERGTLESAFTVDMTVGEDGRVVDVEFRGLPGSASLEQAIRESARERRYRPALLDGFVIEARDRAQITVRRIVRAVR